MKETKFRAIYKPDLEKEGDVLIFEQKEIEYELFFVNGDIQYDFAIPFLDKDWRILQYTGLKDKNGKEIYEGDVVRFSWGNECSNCHETPTWSGKVTFGSLGARVQGFLMADPQNNILGSVEVIGNIYKNPKLVG